MKFTVFVLQLTGDITDSHEHSCAALRANDVTRGMILGFHEMFRENLPKTQGDIIRFRVSLPEDSGKVSLYWVEPDPFAATGMIFIGERPAVTCLYFSGIEPIADALTVRYSQELLVDLVEGMDIEVKRTLKSIAARPAVICVPWPIEITVIERKRFAAWAVGLGAVFFERAADMNRRMEMHGGPNGNEPRRGKFDASDN